MVSASYHSSFRVLEAAKLACKVILGPAGDGFTDADTVDADVRRPGLAFLPEPLLALVLSKLPDCSASFVVWIAALAAVVGTGRARVRRLPCASTGLDRIGSGCFCGGCNGCSGCGCGGCWRDLSGGHQ
jgi:hypothetical protein